MSPNIVKRLNIVVPYRDREAHLREFVPHLRAYFARDKVDRDIPYRVLLIEQEYGLPFNRGALKNIGFLLGRDDSDYMCFHDIDYLPIWADYTWVDMPTPIIWYGAETRPIAPERSTRFVENNLESFFGGVVLVPNNLFSQVNGYANSYWGWGYEDSDLHTRFMVAGINCGRRKGTFLPLTHDNEGFKLDGQRSAISATNLLLYRERWADGKWASGGLMEKDGLSNVAFDVLDRRTIPDDTSPERTAAWEIVTVRLNMQPRLDQIEALASSKVTE